jgi:hypothetical protein
MPYLSETWCLDEVVNWVSSRNPNAVSYPRTLTPLWLHDRILASDFGRALDEVLARIFTGTLEVTALNISTGARQVLSARLLEDLEFYFFDGIPGRPAAFRNSIDKIATWTNLSFSAKAVVALWPAERCGF